MKIFQIIFLSVWIIVGILLIVVSFNLIINNPFSQMNQFSTGGLGPKGFMDQKPSSENVDQYLKGNSQQKIQQGQPQTGGPGQYGPQSGQ